MRHIIVMLLSMAGFVLLVYLLVWVGEELDKETKDLRR